MLPNSRYRLVCTLDHRSELVAVHDTPGLVVSLSPEAARSPWSRCCPVVALRAYQDSRCWQGRATRRLPYAEPSLCHGTAGLADVLLTVGDVRLADLGGSAPTVADLGAGLLAGLRHPRRATWPLGLMTGQLGLALAGAEWASGRTSRSILLPTSSLCTD